MSTEHILKGTVQLIEPIQTFDSGFQKQIMIVNSGGEYPEQWKIEFKKDKINLISNLQVGQPVSVSVNIRGDEWKDKYYVNLDGWKLEAGQMGQTQAAPAPQADGDEIPF